MTLVYCHTCTGETTIEDPGDDPDRKYDEERDRRMLDEFDNVHE